MDMDEPEKRRKKKELFSFLSHFSRAKSFLFFSSPLGIKLVSFYFYLCIELKYGFSSMFFSLNLVVSVQKKKQYFELKNRVFYFFLVIEKQSFSGRKVLILVPL